MPESHTSTRLCTLTQRGSSVAGTTWNDGNNILGVPALPLPVVQGVRFQLRSSASEEPTRIRSMFLGLQTFPYGAVGGTLGATYVVMQNTPDTEPFSATNPPLYDLAPGGAADTTGWTYIVNDFTPAWSNPTAPSTLTCQIGTESTDPVVGTTYYDISSFANLFEDYNYDGIINLSIQIAVTVADYVQLTPLLLVSELDFFTGVAGSKGRERGDSRVRVARDSRYGMPTWTDELVEDDYIEGNWVRAHDWDPEDEYREYITNPREGTRDDDIPNQ